MMHSRRGVPHVVAYGVRIGDLGARDDWICWICEGEVAPKTPAGSPHAASVDHVIPRARGGTNDPANLRLAHRRCNGQRGSRLPELDWPPELGVHEPAPLWPVLQRALRRRGDWEVVAAVAADRALPAERWLTATITTVAGTADWETRLQPLGPSLATLALRTTPAATAGPNRRGRRRRGR
jgi:hypothetical protein